MESEVLTKQETEQVKRDRTFIFLQPIAGPSILGLFAFAAVAFVIGAQYAHWYSSPEGLMFFGPLAIMLGGLGQFAASMWAFRARDGLSTAFHGIWGTFWLGFGILNWMEVLKLVPSTAVSSTLGFWFIALAFISAACAVAALAMNLALFSVMAVITAGAVLMAIGMLNISISVLAVGGYLFMLSALLAWYTGGAIMMEDAFGRRIVPVGEFRPSKEEKEIDPGVCEPGVMHGQWAACMRKAH